MTTRLVRACAGKSHSCETPTISRSKPSAKRISVADGRRETIRIGEAYHNFSQQAARRSAPREIVTSGQAVPLPIVALVIKTRLLVQFRTGTRNLSCANATGPAYAARTD